MRKETKEAISTNLIKKMDERLSSGEKRNCSQNAKCEDRIKDYGEEKEDYLTKEQFKIVSRYYMSHVEEPLEILFHDLDLAYSAYITDEALFHESIVSIINSYKGEALKQTIKPLISTKVPIDNEFRESTVNFINEHKCEAPNQHISHLVAEEALDNKNEPAHCKQRPLGLPTETRKIDGVERVFDECLDLYRRKNHDYSNKGESAFDRAYNKMGAKSLWLRLNDKFTRFESLLFADDEAQVKDEKIEDTLLDLINYAAMGLAKLKGYN